VEGLTHKFSDQVAVGQVYCTDRKKFRAITEQFALYEPFKGACNCASANVAGRKRCGGLTSVDITVRLRETTERVLLCIYVVAASGL
jgi:hypothetical protein